MRVMAIGNRRFDRSVSGGLVAGSMRDVYLSPFALS